MKAIVLAAGFATRLWPLTRDRAKPLLDVGGRPVLDHILDRVLTIEEITEVVVVTNARFHDDFLAWLEGSPRPVARRAVCNGAPTNEERRGGVADMALGIDEALRDGGDEDLLVVAGDNLIGFDLRPFADDYLRRRIPLLLTRRLAGPVPPRRHGEVRLDDEGVVVGFREKPAVPQSPFVATCTYLLPPGVRGLLAEYLASGEPPDAPGHFIAWLARRTPVGGWVARGDFFDIGDLESLENARRALP